MPANAKSIHVGFIAAIRMNLCKVVLEEKDLLLLSLFSELRADKPGVGIHDKFCNFSGCELDLGVRKLVGNSTMQLSENDQPLVCRFGLGIFKNEFVGANDFESELTVLVLVIARKDDQHRRTRSDSRKFLDG